MMPDPYRLARCLSGHREDALKIVAEAKRLLGVNADDIERQLSMIVALAERFHSKRLFSAGSFDWLLQQLPPHERTIWTLRKINQMEYDDIRLILDATTSTLRGRSKRANDAMDRFRARLWDHQIGQALGLQLPIVDFDTRGAQ